MQVVVDAGSCQCLLCMLVATLLHSVTIYLTLLSSLGCAHTKAVRTHGLMQYFLHPFLHSQQVQAAGRLTDNTARTETTDMWGSLRFAPIIA